MIELIIKLAIVVFTAYNNYEESMTHEVPTAEERIIILEKEIAEIKAQQK